MRYSPFLENTSGAAAVEMALVLPILIGLIMGTVEIGVVGLVSNNLDNSLQSAARMVRVGESDAPADAAAFKRQVCAHMLDAQSDCLAKLAISVRTFPDFASAEAAAGDAAADQFNAGGPGDIVLVKATYQWPFFMPFFDLGYRQAGPGSVLLDARTAFKNEPYA